MAATSANVIEATTSAANATLDTSAVCTIIATKLIKGERVTIYVYGQAGDVEKQKIDGKTRSLTYENNSAKIDIGKYQIYKTVTASAVGVVSYTAA